MLHHCYDDVMAISAQFLSQVPLQLNAPGGLLPKRQNSLTQF